jgi:shikimate dehydrogenase
MLVFGAGGAARAVAYGLLHRYAPETLTLVARRPEQADALARDLAEYDQKDAFRVTTFDDAGPAVRSSRLLVNATPLGMHPEPEATPWPDTGDLSAGQVAYDLIYNPEKTRFLRDVERRGGIVIGGMQMLLAQAAASYTQWTGHPFPGEAVMNRLKMED